MQTALFSLHDTTHAVEFATALKEAGWQIIATSESVEVLHAAGIDSTDIDEFTGIVAKYPFPGTLHPLVEQSLTGSEGPCIDLVYVLPYPRSVGKDVGGWTLLSLAAKGDRLAVCSHEDMRAVLGELKENGHVSDAMRRLLIDKVYFGVCCQNLKMLDQNGVFDGVLGRNCYTLLNGENPYQVPAALFESDSQDPLALGNFKQVAGELPCFTNMADADCLIQTISLVTQAFGKHRGSIPHIAIAAKHGNACGMAIEASDQAAAIQGALFGNPRAVWGGEFVCNFAVDGALASLLLESEDRKQSLGSSSWMLDIIIAPHFDAEAHRILGARARRKLFENGSLTTAVLAQAAWQYRFVRGGFLRQPPHSYVLDFQQVERVGRELLESECDSAIIAWAVAWSSNHGGNEVALAREGRLIGAGGGPSTVDAVEIALARARASGHETKGAVFAANAFFPFTDGPDLLVMAHVAAGVVPGGGQRESEIREHFRRSRVSVAYLPEERRGFSRH